MKVQHLRQTLDQLELHAGLSILKKERLSVLLLEQRTPTSDNPLDSDRVWKVSPPRDGEPYKMVLLPQTVSTASRTHAIWLYLGELALLVPKTKGKRGTSPLWFLSMCKTAKTGSMAAMARKFERAWSGVKCRSQAASHDEPSDMQATDTATFNVPGRSAPTSLVNWHEESRSMVNTAFTTTYQLKEVSKSYDWSSTLSVPSSEIFVAR